MLILLRLTLPGTDRNVSIPHKIYSNSFFLTHFRKIFGVTFKNTNYNDDHVLTNPSIRSK